MTASGVVLNGGQSRRMGTDKGSLALGSATMLDTVMDALLPVVDDAYLVGGSQQHREAVLLADGYLGQGPLGALVSAFDALRDAASSAEVLVLVSCDLAELTTQALAELLATHRASGADYVVPLVDGRRQWHCSIWHRRCETQIADAFASGVRSFRPLTHLFSECVVVPRRTQPFDDVDTPADYERARSRLCASSDN